MPTSRIQKLVCTVTAGIAVFVVLAVQPASTTAAAFPSSASAGGVARGKVRIELKGTVLGARGNKGRFTLSGALSDRGRFVDRHHGLDIPRTLYGAKGTIRIIVGPQGSWRITKGTKAYAGLHGRGKEGGLYDRNLHITMTGTVWR
jgi:hypothetical protein